MFAEIPEEKNESRLREMLLERQLVAPQILDACQVAQAEARAEDRDPPSLMQLLLLKRLLTANQLEDLLEVLDKEIPTEQQDQPLPRSTNQHLPGTGGKLGRYHISCEIGQGGLGVVYKARDPQLDRIVALKVLRPEVSEEQLSRFQREAVVAARLSHPGIIRIHEIGVHAGSEQTVYYIVMDYISGGTLTDALPELSLEQRIRLLEQVCQAVGVAHQQQVVHRDLKPDNILLKDDQPVVTDFGLARDTDGLTQLTNTGDILGTPYYMAPEQVLGQQELIGTRTDVWSLGVILYQLLGGDRPFSASTSGGVFDEILYGEPDRLTGPNAPEPLYAICHKALRKSASERYAAAGELGDDLGRWLAGDPVLAQSPTTLSRLTQALLRNRGATGVSAMLLCLLIGMILLSASLLRRHHRREDLRQALREAHANSEWWQAVVIGQQLQSEQPDPAVESIIQGCKAALKRERAEQAALLTAQRKQQRLTRSLMSFKSSLLELRTSMYIKDAHLTEPLRKLRQSLKALAGLEETSKSEPWTLQGMGWYLLGNDRLAQKALLRAVSIDPKDGWANYYLARIHIERAMAARWLSQGDGTAKFEVHAHKAKHYVQQPVAWTGAGPLDRLVANAYLALAQGRDEDVLRHCREGRKRFGGQPGSEEFWIASSWVHRGQQRIEHLTKSLEIRPHNAWAFFARGGTLHRTGELRQAMPDYDRAIQISPEMALAYNARAVLLDQSGKGDLAMQDIETAIRLAPSFALAYSNRGVFEQRAGKLAEALASQSKAIEINPDLSTPWNNRGGVKLAMNDLKSALDDFNEAIRLKKDSMFLTNRGRIFAKLGQKARALADFQEAVKADPGDFWPYFERGSLLLKAAKPRQAVADLTQCARLAPETFWKVHYQRGRANTQLGSFTEAVRDYTRALTIHPHPPAFYRRGLLLYELGHPAAMVDFRQCTKLDPKYWKAWLAIGVILAERGAVEKAREVGNRALTLTPDKAGKARIEQFLRALPRR